VGGNWVVFGGSLGQGRPSGSGRGASVSGHRQQHCISCQRQAQAARNNIFLKKAAAATRAATTTLGKKIILPIFNNILNQNL